MSSVPFTITRSEFRSRRIVRMRRIVVGTTLAVTAILLLLWYMGVFGGNVRTVQSRRVYRSAQLTGLHLNTVLDARQIKTVINLRGEAPDAGWYQSELESCMARNIDHVDIAFSAQRLPPPSELNKLISAFDKAQYPILLHCRGGADRSGLSSVIYKTIYEKVPFEQAYKEQLTWRYGHLAWGTAHAMDDFMALYRKDAKQYSLRDWIAKKYPSVYAAQPASLKGDADDVSKPKKQNLTPSR
jgi:protein tyrosine phosphatase (PTP) superfamily phosphohydrolase (DUF442 family)